MIRLEEDGRLIITFGLFLRVLLCTFLFSLARENIPHLAYLYHSKGRIVVEKNGIQVSQLGLFKIIR